jgi:transcriptional regulator with XRE-family HTH domain
MMANVAAGLLLRNVRLRHGLTQMDLSRRASTTARQVGRIERDEISPSVRTLQRLMRAMGEELVLSTGGAVAGADPVLEQARADLRDLTVAQRVAQSMALSRTATAIAAAATAVQADDDR